jgi:hypothetical protein
MVPDPDHAIAAMAFGSRVALATFSAASKLASMTGAGSSTSTRGFPSSSCETVRTQRRTGRTPGEVRLVEMYAVWAALRAVGILQVVAKQLPSRFRAS